MLQHKAWFYGGIRSVGHYVCVVDTDGIPQVWYRVKGSRRKLRQAIREEYSDTIVMFDIYKKPTN